MSSKQTSGNAMAKSISDASKSGISGSFSDSGSPFQDSGSSFRDSGSSFQDTVTVSKPIGGSGFVEGSYTQDKGASVSAGIKKAI